VLAVPLAHLCTSLPGIVSSSAVQTCGAAAPAAGSEFLSPPRPLPLRHPVTYSPWHGRRPRPRSACLPDSLSINWPRSNRNVGRAILALCQPPGATFCLLLTSKYGGAELAAPEGRKGRDAPATEREKPPFVPFFFNHFLFLSS
jgi:hypothetical protein